MAKFISNRKAVLLLENGEIIEGKAIGSETTTWGELCFNTGMTGYQEIYTDPSYHRQIIVNTMPHIGNYGVMQGEEQSSKIQFAGLVCDKFSSVYSRKQATQSLQDYLATAGIPGISEIDTRRLVRIIRKEGAMNAILSTEDIAIDKLKEQLSSAPSMLNLELSSVVSTKEVYSLEATSAKEKYHIAILDMGIKRSMLDNFRARGLKCTVFPAKTTFKEMEAIAPDGYFVSNGPGDPASTQYAVETVKQILTAEKPLFGICLGHQLLALANGVPTYKMHNGHRGLNQPVKNLLTGKSEITSQNHGFAVNAEALRSFDNIELSHINLNDGTVEGIRLKNKPAFSVQYHPESAPGPHDSRYLFDDFIRLIAASK